MKLPFMDTLGSVGLVGERKALALLFLGFYTTLFLMIGMSARTELPEWVAVFTAMTLMYAVSFFAVAAEWFWGRWFASGLGYWGVYTTVLAWVTTRSLPTPLLIFGAMHGVISLCLGGEKMATLFDAKPAWRARWKLDDQGVIRVRKSVTRAAASLPSVIMFALAPREGQMATVLGVAAFTGVLVGLGGILASRTFGVMALAASGVAMTALFFFGGEPSSVFAFLDRSLFFSGVSATMVPEAGVVGAALLVAAALPFAKPMAAFVLRRR